MNGQNHSFEKNSLKKTIISYKDSIDLVFYNKESSKLYLEKKYEKGLEYAKKEVFLLEKYNIDTKKYTKALYKVAYLYFKTDSLDKALKFHQKVIDLNINPIQSGQSYCEIGRIYERFGKFKTSIEFYKKGIGILEKFDNESRIFTKYINLINTYNNLSDPKYYNELLEFLKKAQNIGKNNNLSLEKLFFLNNHFSILYSKEPTYNFQKAKKYNFKNILISKNDSSNLATTYNNLAALYVKENKDSAEYFIKKGLDFSSKNLTRARLYDNYADFYVHKNEYNKALKNIDKAVAINLKLTNNLESNFNNINFNESLNKTHLIYCLQRKSEILINIYEEEKNITFLEWVIDNVKISDKLVKTILEDISEEKTKLHWISKASEAYFAGIKAAYLLKDKEIAFSFMENNKSLLLIESIFKNIEHSKMPENILLKNNQFKNSISKLENTLKNRKNNFLSDSIFTIKQIHQKYLDSIKKIYPDYFKNNFKFDKVTLLEVQKKIGKNEVIVSYTWNTNEDKNEEVFALLIAHNKIDFFKILDINSFKKTLKTYNNLISKPLETKEQQNIFQNVSYNLYRQLFPNENFREFLKDKKITILPDGEIHNISFEALITKENTFDYLLKSSSISYAYSMSFLKQNDKLERETSNSFVGYSPITFKNQELVELTNTKEELEKIQKYFDGYFLLNNDANKSHFLSESKNFKIIHLATHADASKNPWIAFSDNKLALHELYTYKNNADLVVLSACNTSSGELVVSEGVLSLARGFFYSGAKSVVSSLWNVNDKSTSFIMDHFYENLKSGQTKSEALTNAKRTYLKTHSLSEKSPYYWSSFVLIGDANSLDLPSYNYVYIVLVFIIIFFIIFYFKKK